MRFFLWSKVKILIIVAQTREDTRRLCQRRVISLEPSANITGSGGVQRRWSFYKAAETFEINAPSAVQKDDRCSSAEAVSASRQKESTWESHLHRPALGPPSAQVSGGSLWLVGRGLPTCVQQRALPSGEGSARRPFLALASHFVMQLAPGAPRPCTAPVGEQEPWSKRSVPVRRGSALLPGGNQPLVH